MRKIGVQWREEGGLKLGFEPSSARFLVSLDAKRFESPDDRPTFLQSRHRPYFILTLDDVFENETHLTFVASQKSTPTVCFTECKRAFQRRAV